MNIGDWGLATGHLRVDEEGICLRLINYFISNEGPIPANTTQVFRKLRLTDVAELATAILEEFFVRNENGDWSHPSSVELIREYQDKADTSRENGKKEVGQEHLNRLKCIKPRITQQVINLNPPVTQA
nr:DUF1376 domain-containing protein [Polynucleobacter sp. Tro8-14-1]